jgi:hypothetical protein
MQKTFEPSFNHVLVFNPYERLIQASCEGPPRCDEHRTTVSPADAFKLGALPDDGVMNAKTCCSKVRDYVKSERAFSWFSVVTNFYIQ